MRALSLSLSAAAARPVARCVGQRGRELLLLAGGAGAASYPSIPLEPLLLLLAAVPLGAPSRTRTLVAPHAKEEACCVLRSVRCGSV
jgi:hypothetical protein